jgi:hypothetical protein
MWVLGLSALTTCILLFHDEDFSQSMELWHSVHCSATGNLAHISQPLHEATFQMCFRLVLSDYTPCSRGRELYSCELILRFLSVICYIIQVLEKLNLKSVPYFFCFA